MDNMRDYLEQKAAELGLDRQHQLAEIQEQLDELYPGQCRAASVQDGVLKIMTPNASVASELRLRQHELMQRFSIARIRIQIG